MNSNDLLISVVIPLYNVEKYIEKCINSVLNQTYPHFELLIVNDGSTDDSVKVIEKFNDPRIRIIHKKNGGQSDARNLGIKESKGDCIYFMDSDDWIEPNLLQVSVNCLEKQNADFIIFGYCLDREDLAGNVLSQKLINHREVTFDKHTNNFVFEKNTLNLLGYVWNKLYKREFIINNSLNFEIDAAYIEDILFNIKACLCTTKIIFIEQELYHYIDRPSFSQVKSYHHNALILNKKRFFELNKFLENWSVNSTYNNNVISESYISSIRYCINNLYYKNSNLKDQQIKAEIRKILEDELTQKHIKKTKSNNARDLLYNFLIYYKCTSLIHFIFNLTKK